MHNSMSATGVLAHLIYVLESNLSELTSAENKNDYIMGSWEACIECLEIIGCWAQAKDYGLNYNPEIKFNMETASVVARQQKQHTAKNKIFTRLFRRAKSPHLNQ